MRIYFAIAFLFSLIQYSSGQPSGRPAKYWIEFTDKKETPYSIFEPAKFLSARAIQRRNRAGIAVDTTDLPVDPAYTSALTKSGATLHLTSKWLNAAAVIADSITVSRIKQLPFVRQVSYLGKDISIKNPPNRPAQKRVPAENIKAPPPEAGVYGYSGLQNSLLNLFPMYLAGVRGEGIWVAVLDGGFSQTDILNFFDSLDYRHRLFQGRDFVERDFGVYESAQHGTSVLSVMGANIPGFFVGTAPNATYFLVKTEDTGGEFPIEEANWVAGLEWADSLGIDIVNASLGYTTFNDPSLSHSFKTLDGKTALGSRGAAIGARKGMIICNSAGNSGDEPWRHIGVPADAPGVIAVGAVSNNLERASFSSFGPTADGRIKPDLVAPGDELVVAGQPPFGLGISSGTSLASPMLAGGFASLWSAFPDRPASEIVDAVFASADQFLEPDNERGYGLPDFSKAWLTLGGFFEGDKPNDAHGALFSFNRNRGVLALMLFESVKPDAMFTIVSWLKKSVKQGPAKLNGEKLPLIQISGLEKLPPGSYQVRWEQEGAVRFFTVSIP